MGKGGCGRTACALDPNELKKRIKYDKWPDTGAYHPSYNIAPCTRQPALYMNAQGEKEIRIMRWGVVPAYSKEPVMRNFNTINARSDNLGSTMWRRLVGKRRCVLFAQGYFEWSSKDGKKTPYFIHLPDDKLIALAGIYDIWKPKSEKPKAEEELDALDEAEEKSTEGGEETLAVEEAKEQPPTEELWTYALMTTDPAPVVAFIHDRMPCLLQTEEEIDMWINCEKYSVEQVVPLLRPYGSPPLFKKSSSSTPNSPVKASPSSSPSSLASPVKDVKTNWNAADIPPLQYHKVPPLVNQVKNKSPDVIMSVEEYGKKRGIMGFFSKKEKEPVAPTQGTKREADVPALEPHSQQSPLKKVKKEAPVVDLL